MFRKKYFKTILFKQKQKNAETIGGYGNIFVNTCKQD